MIEDTKQDSLTKFRLRNALEPFLIKFIADAKITNQTFSLAIIDLDHFKKYNDRFGHLFGDEVLKYFSSTLRLSLGENICYFFRYGGDEFIIVLPDKGANEAYYWMLQLKYNMAHRHFLFKNKFFKITASCGIAEFPSDGKTMEELMKKSDKAMYFSKRHGRGHITAVNKIKYIKIRNTIVILISACITLGALYVLYPFILKRHFAPILDRITNIKITTKPKNLDIVVLKNGAVFEGEIVAETSESLTLNVYMERGSGLMNFRKSEIESIRYRSKAQD